MVSGIKYFSSDSIIFPTLSSMTQTTVEPTPKMTRPRKKSRLMLRYREVELYKWNVTVFLLSWLCFKVSFDSPGEGVGVLKVALFCENL